MLATSGGGDTGGGAGTAAHRHRRDIDGLRAVAIVPILLLHCGLTKLRGGFIGVDIFFVISGYLITGIILRDLANGSFNLARFYRHRIVRILPALGAMMAVALVAGALILLPNQIRDLGRSAAATSVFGSNIYFYLTADYFAQSSDAKPLVHTWSLAVEEQFYLLHPFLLMALRGLSRRRLAMVFGGLAVVSLGVGAWLAARDPSAGFFLLPARVWELSLGALVALGAFPAIASARLRGWVSLTALAVLGASCVVISGGWSFPVPWAIPPAVATAVLLAYGETGPSARLLSLAPMRAIGLISYSLYLWHRPIIAFYQHYAGSTLRLVDAAALIALSFGAAMLSYRLVERPAIRRFRSGYGWGPHKLAAAGIAFAVAAGLALATYADTIRPLPPQLARAASYLGFDTSAAGRAQFDTDRCFSLPTGKPYDLNCLRLASDRPNIVLLGDSHGAHLSAALREAIAPTHLVQVTAAGCRPLLHGKGVLGCRRAIEAGMRLDFARTQAVVLSGRWLDFEMPALIETIRYLRGRGARVIVLGPSVEYDADLPLLIVRAGEASDPSLPERYRLAKRIALDREMAAPIAAAGATYVSAVAAECPGGRCRVLTTDGSPFHFDHSHLTPAGAREIARALVEKGRLNP
ncbi:acyltransferase family protein [Sphingomonas sp. Y38-1Y]|uniref:acyltransferase family protein n=1 Tax=Sphingomonas sp. Y38-1Y TaxID=3078265 RepID=UPI0028EDBDC5|nr:acyltransferase family protein [Sphingomonas sp. Y38-1Y]